MKVIYCKSVTSEYVARVVLGDTMIIGHHKSMEGLKEYMESEILWWLKIEVPLWFKEATAIEFLDI